MCAPAAIRLPIRTLNPNLNPRTHPNLTLFLTLTGTKLLKENKNDTGI